MIPVAVSNVPGCMAETLALAAGHARAGRTQHPLYPERPGFHHPVTHEHFVSTLELTLSSGRRINTTGTTPPTGSVTGLAIRIRASSQPGPRPACCSRDFPDAPTIRASTGQSTISVSPGSAPCPSPRLRPCRRWALGCFSWAAARRAVGHTRLRGGRVSRSRHDPPRWPAQGPITRAVFLLPRSFGPATRARARPASP